MAKPVVHMFTDTLLTGLSQYFEFKLAIHCNWLFLIRVFLNVDDCYGSIHCMCYIYRFIMSLQLNDTMSSDSNILHPAVLRSYGLFGNSKGLIQNNNNEYSWPDKKLNHSLPHLICSLI